MSEDAAETRLLFLLVDAAEAGDIDPGDFIAYNGRDGFEVIGVPESTSFEWKHLRALERNGLVDLVGQGKGQYRGGLNEAAYSFAEDTLAPTPSVLMDAVVLSGLYDASGGDPEKAVIFNDLIAAVRRPENEVSLAVRRLKAQGSVNPLTSSGGAILKVRWTPQGFSNYLRQSKAGDAPARETAASNDAEAYIAERRIDELRQITVSDFDLRRLVQLCEELNTAAANGSFIAMGALQRTIIHHVPPIFGAKNFNTVVAQAPKGSFKRHMEHLLGSLKNVVDQVLHVQAGRSSSPVERSDVNCGLAINELIQRVIDELRNSE